MYCVLNLINFDEGPPAMHGKYLFICFVWACSVSVSGQGIRFVSPIGGTYLRDYFIYHYVDNVKFDGAAKDPFCGHKTQKDHEGTDYILKSFPQMDSLVPVYAVADGTVSFTVDSLNDRNTENSDYKIVGGDFGYNLKWSPARYGNQVVIHHKDSLYTLYAGLKKYSVTVKPGDSVRSGQVIAYVGSSGYSNGPHLHFEVRDRCHDNDVVDPFSGPCGSSKSLWVNQPAYDTSIRVMESGFVPYAPRHSDSLAERILVKSDFNEHQPYINHWILISGLHKNDILRTEWYQPGLILWSSYQMTIKNDEWYHYYWSWTRNPLLKDYYGDGWTCAVYVNNKLIVNDKFNIRKPKKYQNNKDR